MSKTAWNKRLCSLFAALLLLCAFALPAFAGDDTPQDTPQNGGYTYTITLSAGAHAVFADGSDVFMYKNLPAGEQVNFSAQIDELNDALLRSDSKYYILGVRLSGQEQLVTSAFEVKRDETYVVAYGIRGTMKDCTINYLDTAGNPLAAPRILRANVGDKPIVPYAYIEGYEPQAYNLTKTITDNDADNVFNFIYTPVTAAAVGAGGTETVYVTVDVPAAPAAPAAPGAGGGAAAPAGPAGPAAPAGPGGETLPEEQTPLGPQEIVDLDDQNVPEAGPGGAPELTDASGEGSAGLWMVWTGLAAAALLLLVAVPLIRRKKKANAREEE